MQTCPAALLRGLRGGGGGLGGASRLSLFVLLCHAAVAAQAADAASDGGDRAPSNRYEIQEYDGQQAASLHLAPFGQRTRNFTFGNESVAIFQDWASGGVAAVVWDAAVVMCKYIAQHAHLFAGRAVLELGAGTGLAGICAAKFGAIVTLTDREQALANLERNVRFNLAELPGSQAAASPDARQSATVLELDWSSNRLQPTFARRWDIVLGADIVYDGGNPSALHEVLLALDAGLVYLACRLRYDRDADFVQQLVTAGSFVLQLELRDEDTGVHLYALRRSTARRDDL